MDMQDVSSLVIPEGVVRTINDKDGKLLWGKISYNTKYGGDTYQQTYSGKNLFHIQNNTRTETNITWTITENYHAVGYGTADSGAGSYLYGSYTQIDYPTDGNFTFSISSAINAPIYYRFYDDNNVNLGQLAIPKGSTSVTGTIPSGATKYRVLLAPTNGTVYNIDIYLQLERGNTPTSIEPYTNGPAPNPSYPQTINLVTGAQIITISDGTNTNNYTVNLGSTELCKIGTHQDYIYKTGDDWYVHKEIGKIILNGTNLNFFAQPSGNYGIFYSSKISDAANSNVLPIFSDHFHYSNQNEAGRGYQYGSRLYLYYGDNNTTANEFKTWLGSNNTTAYYTLDTSVDTQIMDNTLINQLDMINVWLTRYGYSATVSGNLPLIIDKTNL